MGILDRLDINIIFKTLVAIGGATASYLFGGWSVLLGVLVTLVIIDVMFGTLASAVEGKLASGKSFIGIARKVAIFTLVAVAHLADVVLNSPDLFRDATIFFYMAGEGMSILENAGRLNIPIPPPLRKALEIFGERSEVK